jgi:uncharacterized protein YciI
VDACAFSPHPKTIPFYWVLSEPLPGKTPELHREVLKDHLRFQFESERTGKLFAAGPLGGGLGRAPPTGFYILFTETEEGARAIVEKDPFHVRGLNQYEMKPWNFFESSIIGVAARAWLNGTDTSLKSYWPPEDWRTSHARWKGKPSMEKGGGTLR